MRVVKVLLLVHASAGWKAPLSRPLPRGRLTREAHEHELPREIAGTLHPPADNAHEHAVQPFGVLHQGQAQVRDGPPADSPATSPLAWAAPRLALLAMAGTCGANFPLLHIAEAAAAPADVALVRFACALLPFVPMLVQRAGSGEADRTMGPGLEIGAWCALGYVTQAVGLSLTTPARAFAGPNPTPTQPHARASPTRMCPRPGGAFICALFLVVTPLVNGLQGRRVAAQARSYS